MGTEGVTKVQQYWFSPPFSHCQRCIVEPQDALKGLKPAQSTVKEDRLINHLALTLTHSHTHTLTRWRVEPLAVLRPCNRRNKRLPSVVKRNRHVRCEVIQTTGSLKATWISTLKQMPCEWFLSSDCGAVAQAFLCHGFNRISPWPKNALLYFSQQANRWPAWVKQNSHFLK